jgi:ribosome biogenesis protein BRX1
MYFEPRKGADMYLWIGKFPHGPCAKFQIQGVNASTELKMTGNCLKGSRPVLSFDKAFTPSENDFLKNKHLVLIKELMSCVFNTPRYHPKCKPFVDHVYSFKNFGDRIWFRNYQIMNENDEKFTEKDQLEGMNLVEIGPRFGLIPIKILAGCFTGDTVWQNGKYITPAKIRSKKFGRYMKKRVQKENRRKVLEENQLEETPLDRLYYED